MLMNVDDKLSLSHEFRHTVRKRNHTVLPGVLTNIYSSESNVDAVNKNVDGNVDETLFQLFLDKFL